MSGSLARIEIGIRIRCLWGTLFQLCLLAYAWAGWLPVGPVGVWTLGVAACLNLASYLAARGGHERPMRLAHALAPVWGIATWAVLSHETGGVASSLFVVGLWFEILLSGLSYRTLGIAATAVLALVGLWAQEWPLGWRDSVQSLSLWSAWLVFVGVATAWARRYWQSRQASLADRLTEQQFHLESIEEKLRDAHNLASLGNQTARLGHGLKNAVHNLRGFTALIERKEGERTPAEQAALSGLRGAIDQLESLAHDSLRPAEDGSGGDEESNLRSVIEDAAQEIRRCYPEVRCRVVWDARDGNPKVPRGILNEVLSNLLHNSAQSMDEAGDMSLEVHRIDSRYEIQVNDEGPGVSAEMAQNLFRPGHSTKANGHGMGLYLARQLMEAQGGSLSHAERDRGASFRVGLPESWEG